MAGLTAAEGPALLFALRDYKPHRRVSQTPRRVRRRSLQAPARTASGLFCVTGARALLASDTPPPFVLDLPHCLAGTYRHPLS